MKNLKILLIGFILLVMFLIPPSLTNAHSGRTDAYGGHNCYVGACAGTYHYHNGGYVEPEPEYEEDYYEPEPDEEEYNESEPEYTEPDESTPDITDSSYPEEESPSDDSSAGWIALGLSPFAGYGVYKLFKS